LVEEFGARVVGDGGGSGRDELDLLFVLYGT
jgi:hypothetical protein